MKLLFKFISFCFLFFLSIQNVFGYKIYEDKSSTQLAIEYLKNNNVILSSEGNELQEKMNVFTRVYNNIKVEGKEANSLIDNALDELSKL